MKPPGRLFACIGAALLFLAGLPNPAQAGAACSTSSGDTLSPLVELYTSEGCSSCPPADNWLSGLKTGAAVPLAWHVDYWDYLGWRDRYSHPQFSRRQRDAVKRSGGRVVYTPQVMLDGRDFRHWQDAAAFERALRAAAAKPARASLTLSAAEQGAGNWRLRLEGKLVPRKGRAAAYLAVYENGLESDVRAGENRGARLRHSHVVREWAGPAAADAEGRFMLSRELARKDIVFSRAGIAAFVEDPDTGEVLQAVALPFCGN